MSSKRWISEKEIVEFYSDEIYSSMKIGDEILLVELENSIWFCKLWTDQPLDNIEFRQATDVMLDIWNKNTMSSENELINLEAQGAFDKIDALESGKHNDQIEVANMAEFTGSKEKYIDTFFKNAFEPSWSTWRNSFSL